MVPVPPAHRREFVHPKFRTDRSLCHSRPEAVVPLGEAEERYQKAKKKVQKIKSANHRIASSRVRIGWIDTGTSMNSQWGPWPPADVITYA